MRKPRMLRCSTTTELAQLWYMRYGNTAVATTDTSRPVLTLRTIAKLTKMTVNQVSIRLSWYKEKAKVSIMNPEESNSMMDVRNKGDNLSWITEQATRNHTSVLRHCTSNNAEAANDTKVGAASGTGGTEVFVHREHFGELFVELLLFSGQKAVKKTDFHQENVLS